MKKLLVSAAFVAMTVASSCAFAEGFNTGNVQISGDVDARCSGSAAGAQDLGTIVGTDGTPSTAPKAVKLALGVSCNTDASLTITSTYGGLSKDGNSCTSNTTATCVRYGTAVGSWNDVTATLTIGETIDSSSSTTSTGPDDVDLTITLEGSTTILDDGAYTDIMTASVVPGA